MTAPHSIVDTTGLAAVTDDHRSETSDEEKGDKHSEIVQTLAHSGESEEDVLTKYYAPPDSYEGKHRWDPKAKWTADEERKVRRKLDLRITFLMCICFAAMNLDRYNLGNALSDNLLNDLNMTTADYNIGNTIFYSCFLVAELPSQMIGKKLGTDRWIPIQILLWSTIAIAQIGLSGKTSFYILRALLGLFEGGFIADSILYLSYWFTAAELTTRLTFFWVSMSLSSVVGSLMAAGILQLRHHTSLPGWKWLFMIEGVLTWLVGLFCFFYMPASATQTKGIISRKPWFTEREETIIVNKILRDDPTKSSMHNREGISLKELWKSLCDYDLWPVYAIGGFIFITSTTVTAYLTLTIKSLNFTTFQTNLLTIPSTIMLLCGNLALCALSRIFKEHLMVASLAPWWWIIFLTALVNIPDDASRWLRWALTTCIVGYPYPNPILVSMTSMNAGSVRTRTVAASLYNMFVQAATLIGSNIYQPGDAPYYHKGNKALIGIVCWVLVLFWFAKGWYIFRNKQKAKVWDAMTTEQKEVYLATTTDEGNKRLDYRFQH